MRLRRLIRRRILPRQRLKPSLNGPIVIRRKRGHLLPGGYRQIPTLQGLSEGRRTKPLPNLALGMRVVPLLNRPPASRDANAGIVKFQSQTLLVGSLARRIQTTQC